MAIISQCSRNDPEVIRGADIATCMASLGIFLRRYQDQVQRAEQERHLQVYVEGLVSGIERKSIEPIATAHGLYRRPLQHFGGAGKWSDTEVRDEMRRHIVEQVGDPGGVLILDGSGVHKQGSDSVGVARQYWGRLGKIDNCQVGIYVAYSTPCAFTLLDTDIYLPQEWIDDPVRRDKTYIPQDIQFRTNWQIADDLLQRLGPHVPHAWVVGDDEYGRPTEFRDRLADRGERYRLEVPSNTLVRRPAHWPGRARKWGSVRRRRDQHPQSKWKRITVRDGAKGPIEVLAFCTRVETKRLGAAGAAGDVARHAGAAGQQDLVLPGLRGRPPRRRRVGPCGGASPKTSRGSSAATNRLAATTGAHAASPHLRRGGSNDLAQSS